MKEKPLAGLSLYIKYGLSLLIVIAATWFKILFFTIIGPQTPFLLYLGVVLIISRRFGKRPAFFGLTLCMAATSYFFLSPYNSFFISSERAVIQLFAFGLEGYLVIMVSDALKKALNKNQADSQRFQAILEKSSDGVVLVNAAGKRVYCSPSVKNVIGYTDEEYLNMPPLHLCHPEEAGNVREKYNQVVAAYGSSLILLCRLKHKNGHWIWVESRFTNSLNDPKVQSLIVNFNNVTERVETDQSRKDFIGVVAHELKSPLTSVKLYGQVLVKKLETLNDKTYVSFASKITQQASHMENMIAYLMEVATINAGRMQLCGSDFDFNLIVSEIAENMQHTTDKHYLKTELYAIAKLHADKEKISQVVINLVSNAIKYSPAGGIILIKSQKKENSLIVSVIDPGIGIPANNVDKVFDRLYRVNNTDGVKGLGLGLYICQEIIRLHNGAIGVESEEGMGSVFWFSLPLI